MPKYHGGASEDYAALEIEPMLHQAGSVNGTGVDMAGWDGVVFEAVVGAMVASSTYDLRVVGGALANFSGAVNITGAAITQVPDTENSIVVAIDVYRPTNRYVRVVSTVAVANVNVAVSARRYRATGRTPVSIPTNYQYISVSEN